MLQPKEPIGRRNGRRWSFHSFDLFAGVLLFVRNSLYLWFVTNETVIVTNKKEDLMKIMNVILACVLGVLLAGCSTVPITGRSQIMLVQDSEILSSSALQYKQFLSKVKISKNATSTAQVRRVGQKVAAATMHYLKQNGLGDMASQMKWEFNVVEDKAVNAFCMPGGKIVVYTGLLKLVGSDAELATVISHEVSHAVARHSNERISQEYLRQMGGNLLGAAVSNKSAALQTIIGQAYGVGSQVLVALPYNRKQEYEADKMGLVFMAMAGYNPNAAITFWQKMAAQGSGQVEFLSTHPSDANRIAAIRQYMPEAMKYYKGK